MKNLVLSLLFVFFVSPVFAAEGMVEDTSTVNTDWETLYNWLEVNEKDVMNSLGSKLVSKKGNIVRVKHYTPKGVFELDLKVSLVKNANGAVFTASLHKDYSGKISYYRNQITLRGNGRNTNVALYAKVTVTDRRIKDWMIRRNLKNMSNNFFSYLRRNF